MNVDNCSCVIQFTLSYSSLSEWLFLVFMCHLCNCLSHYCLFNSSTNFNIVLHKFSHSLVHFLKVNNKVYSILEKDLNNKMTENLYISHPRKLREYQNLRSKISTIKSKWFKSKVVVFLFFNEKFKGYFFSYKPSSI